MKGFLGLLMILVGGGIAVFAGLCSLRLAEAGPAAFFFSFLFSGVPIVVGVGLIKWGKSLMTTSDDTDGEAPMSD